MEDYISPLNSKDLQEILVGLFNGDVNSANNFLKSLRQQRPNQSLKWHLSAAIHLILLNKRNKPDELFENMINRIIADNIINKFDVPPSF
ncbi:MAG TPA: hypothetical protein VK203_24585 [Nostocaceae cyanobacterium]|nr:hypothetical protein [Nostocaceae cyanobacterium]